jgi:ankyrin repeat protein
VKSVTQEISTCSGERVGNVIKIFFMDIGEFIDAAVLDQEKALRMIKVQPDLLCARRGLHETALHFLAIEGYTDAVRFLAELGADVNVQNEFRDTPLIDVATLGNVEMAAILLRFGADPNARSETRDNVLCCAVRSGSPELVDLLLSAGARDDYAMETGDTVFDALPTDQEQRKAIVDVLLKHQVCATEDPE